MRRRRRAGHRREADRRLRRVGHPAGRGRRGGRRCRCSPGTTATTARSWPRPARSCRAARWGRGRRRGHRAVLQAGRLLRGRRRLAAAARRRSDPAEPHPRGQQPALAGRGHRPGAGGDVERDPRVRRGGHRGHGVHVRERCARHLPAVRHRRLAAILGADLAGEQELRQLSRRGLLPRRRHQGVAVRADDAAQGLRGEPSWWEPFDLIDRGRRRAPIRWPTRSSTSPP